MDGMWRSVSMLPQSEGKTPSDPPPPSLFYHFKLRTAGVRTYSCGRHLPAGRFVQLTVKPSDGRFSRLPTLPLFHMSPAVSPGRVGCLTLKPPGLFNLPDSADSSFFFINHSLLTKTQVVWMKRGKEKKSVFNQCFEMMWQDVGTSPAFCSYHRHKRSSVGPPPSRPCFLLRLLTSLLIQPLSPPLKKWIDQNQSEVSLTVIAAHSDTGGVAAESSRLRDEFLMQLSWRLCHVGTRQHLESVVVCRNTILPLQIQPIPVTQAGGDDGYLICQINQIL